MNPIYIAVFVVLGLGVLGGGGYIAVNTIVDKKVAEFQEELLAQHQMDSTTVESVTTDTTQEDVEIKANSKPLQTAEKPKTSGITFTTPSGAIIDEKGNAISGPVSVAPSKPESSLQAGIRVLTSEEIYELVSPSVVLVKASSGNGSGFVIEGGKYTITNEHVIESDKEVTITLQSGASFTGYVLGRNDTLDLALIYNGNQRPPAVKIGSSDVGTLRIGSDVYALGYPLSNSYAGLKTVTFTKGTLSARQDNFDDYPGTLLQMDAAINHGNSGGPLVNNRGEVVGVNSYGIGAAQGLFFAIPAATLTANIPALSLYGESRLEVIPLGTTISINRSLLFQMELNDKLSCTQLNFKGNDLNLCNLYRNYKNDYVWNIIQDI